MKVKPLHIIEGWYKSKVHASGEALDLSQKRLSECMGCKHAVNSSVLKFINGTARKEATKICNLCKCPLVEKSLVSDEKCQIGKWDKYDK